MNKDLEKITSPPRVLEPITEADKKTDAKMRSTRITDVVARIEENPTQENDDDLPGLPMQRIDAKKSLKHKTSDCTHDAQGPG